MKYFQLILGFAFFFCSLIIGSETSVASGNGNHPDFPGLCHIKDYKTMNPENDINLKPGSRAPSRSDCCEYSCHESLFYQLACCGAIAAGPGQTLSDISLVYPYPDCCRMFEGIDYT